MVRIPPVTPEQTPPAAIELLARVKGQLGMTPNLHQTLAHAPAALRAYCGMTESLAAGVLDKRVRESIAIATAATNGCAYCASAHTELGKAVGIDKKELEENLFSRSSDPKTAAALTFGSQLLDTRGSVSDAAVESIRAAGFSTPEIVEISTHVGLNLLTNIFNNLAQTEIDFPPITLVERS